MSGSVALNTINYQEMIFSFLGGLGLFLFSIKYMGDGLQMSAGEKLRHILDKYTTSPFLGVLVGIFVTALIQSSSGTSVITIGLIGAGLLTVKQGIGIIMGANIGTTITTVIMGFNISKYSLPIIFIGAFCLFFIKSEKINNFGRIAFGFGGIFYALTLMSNAMYPLRFLPEFKQLMIELSKSPFLGIGIGTLLTMLVQASSATIGILQSIYNDGLITMKAALPVLFGDNIGTTITAIIAVLGSSTAAKRLAAAHVTFNVIGTIIFTILLVPFTFFVTQAEKILGLNPKVAIAFAHASFNIATTVLLFPFINVLEYIVTKLIKESNEEKEEKINPLDMALIHSPIIALGQVKTEMGNMLNLALENVVSSVDFFHNRDEKISKKVIKGEEKVNRYDENITNYLSILSRELLTDKESEEITLFMDMCRDVERISDHAHGIVKDVQYEIKKNLTYSEYAHNEMDKLLSICQKMIENTIETLQKSDKEKAFKVLDLYNELYAKEKKIRKEHIKRLSNETCDLQAGLYYIDVISHFTRIGDHTRNLVERMLENRI